MPVPAMAATAVMKRTILQTIDIDFLPSLDGIIILHFRIDVYWQNTQICERFFVEFVFIANEDRDAHSRSCELRGCIGDGLAFPRAPSPRRSRQCSDFFSDKNKPGGVCFGKKFFLIFIFLFGWYKLSPKLFSIQITVKHFWIQIMAKLFFNFISTKKPNRKK